LHRSATSLSLHRSESVAVHRTLATALAAPQPESAASTRPPACFGNYSVAPMFARTLCDCNTNLSLSWQVIIILPARSNAIAVKCGPAWPQTALRCITLRILNPGIFFHFRGVAADHKNGLFSLVFYL